MMIHVDDPRGPNLITESKSGRGSHNSGSERCGMRRTEHTVAGFEDGEEKPQAKECSLASRSWEWNSADSQEENRDLGPTVPVTEFCQ